MTQEEYVEEVERRGDTYERTIHAIVCLRSALCWDDDRGGYLDGCRFACGRRMTPPRGGDECLSDDLTPDVVVQFNHRSGLVGEVKLTASTDRDFQKAEGQIRKYDVDLIGWYAPSETIASHQLCCLVDTVHVGDALRHFANCPPFTRDLLLLSAGRYVAHDTFFQFELRQGSFAEERLAAKFAPNVTVPLEPMLPEIGPAKFCDAKPPCVEWTMTVLWHNYFPNRDLLETREEMRGDQMIEQRKIVLGDAGDFLREGYSICRAPGDDERQPDVPKIEWIKEAMEHFVAIRRANPDEDDSGVFWVSYSSEAHATNLEDFARQVFSASPPSWATPDTQAQLHLPHTVERSSVPPSEHEPSN